MIFSHVKISYFLRVFKYDFSQWPKILYNTYVYIINDFYLLVLINTTFYSLAALAIVLKILFSPLEDKSHIFALPCNILYVYMNRVTCITGE
jgi:hypothetical protein